uniref:Uncharacterized protein n=1 Tax=Calidris pygmaea TaxID=425635 RepID=A0A8C3K3Q1_9CHAR
DPARQRSQRRGGCKRPWLGGRGSCTCGSHNSHGPASARLSQFPATTSQMPFLLLLTWGDSVVPSPAKQSSHLRASWP